MNWHCENREGSKDFKVFFDTSFLEHLNSAGVWHSRRGSASERGARRRNSADVGVSAALDMGEAEGIQCPVDRCLLGFIVEHQLYNPVCQ